MVSFNETRGKTSRKYVVEQGLSRPNWSKNLKNFGGAPPLLLWKSDQKRKIFRVFLPLRNTLVGSLNEMTAPTSRKYVASKGIMWPNLSKTFQTFWLLSSVSGSEEEP